MGNDWTNLFINKKNMTLTSHYQHAKKGKDGKSRNYMIYFLNGVEILKQKMPFETNYDHGFQNHTHFLNVYFLNGKIYQTRTKFNKTREVSWPISKKRLEKLNIPKDLKIELS